MTDEELKGRLKDMKPIPENYLKLMSPKDRAPLGKAGRTLVECLAISESKTERELQNQIRSHCTRYGFICFASRFGKKTTRLAGEPDLIVLHPQRVLFIECKIGKGKLSDSQELLSEKMKFLGHANHVVRTLDEFRDVFGRGM